MFQGVPGCRGESVNFGVNEATFSQTKDFKHEGRSWCGIRHRADASHHLATKAPRPSTKLNPGRPFARPAITPITPIDWLPMNDPIGTTSRTGDTTLAAETGVPRSLHGVACAFAAA